MVDCGAFVSCCLERAFLECQCIPTSMHLKPRRVSGETVGHTGSQSNVLRHDATGNQNRVDFQGTDCA